MMRAERRGPTPPRRRGPLVGRGRYQSVGEAARGGRFTVYFQPKIDMTHRRPVRRGGPGPRGG